MERTFKSNEFDRFLLSLIFHLSLIRSSFSSSWSRESSYHGILFFIRFDCSWASRVVL